MYNPDHSSGFVGSFKRGPISITFFFFFFLLEDDVVVPLPNPIPAVICDVGMPPTVEGSDAFDGAFRSRIILKMSDSSGSSSLLLSLPLLLLLDSSADGMLSPSP